MLWAPVVAWETSTPPTTPRGSSRWTSTAFTTRMGPSMPPRSAARARSARHAAHRPAGHVQRLAVHVVRPRADQEEDGARRLLRGPRPADGDRHRRQRAQLLGDAELDPLARDLHRVLVHLGLRQPRVDETVGDRVDVDLELPPLLGERPREADDAGLARRVVRLAGVAERAGGRGRVDDLAEDLLAALALLLGGLAQVRG